MPSAIEQSRHPHTDEKEESRSRGKGQPAGMPISEVNRKRATRRGANIHIQDEDQAPTGKNAGDTKAAAELAESKRHRGRPSKAASAR